MTDPRSYPFDQLADAIGGSLDERAARLRMSTRQLNRLHGTTLTADRADLFACRAGLHPGEVWPRWWDDHLTPLDRVFAGIRERSTSFASIAPQARPVIVADMERQQAS